jgi:hypothetical protein
MIFELKLNGQRLTSYAPTDTIRFIIIMLPPSSSILQLAPYSCSSFSFSSFSFAIDAFESHQAITAITQTEKRRPLSTYAVKNKQATNHEQWK